LWNGDVLLQEINRDSETGQEQNSRTYYFEPETFKPIALSEGDEVYQYHLDHLGTPDTLTNASGEVVWNVSYKSYGNIAVAQCEDIAQPIRFQGQYCDEESGLHYNRHRYFDPLLGQFTTQDPVGLMGGDNGYMYAPNPVRWVDPYGLTCKENSWNRFQKNTKGHFANSSDASNSYRRMKEVQAMPKASRPDPSTYLPQSYIDAHEAKFAGGASYFAPKWALDEFGRNPVGRADGQFVMTKSQLDQVLVRTNGDMSLIEKELGIPDGDWQGQEMVVIEISDPGKHNVRIPTGRESGANPLWEPGGKLPTGHDEAVVDAIPEGEFKELSISDATESAKGR
ncbi:RHS repeat domain-containing protein, partial [Microbulbifer mangrovi]|uniref:RHS repeat domain-containing protein n=1 Tax=Microbulbifer mangrovi TaxID=927787 RepID=UPI00117C2D24